MTFTVKGRFNGAPFEVPYASVDDCLRDDGLRSLFSGGNVSCSAWLGDTRVTRDAGTWRAFAQAVIANSSTLLRGIHQEDGHGHQDQVD